MAPSAPPGSATGVNTSDGKSFCWNSYTIYNMYAGFSLLLAINFHKFSQPDWRSAKLRIFSSTPITWLSIRNIGLHMQVADPGFPKGGGSTRRGDTKPIFCQNFPEKCMKMKRIVPGGAIPKFYRVEFSLVDFRNTRVQWQSWSTCITAVLKW